MRLNIHAGGAAPGAAGLSADLAALYRLTEERYGSAVVFATTQPAFDPLHDRS